MTTSHRILTRLFALALVFPTPARADVVVLVSSDTRATELAEELDRELHGFGHTVTHAEAGLPGTAEQRRAVAALRAADFAAGAAIWIEPDAPQRIRALARASEVVEDAPLPSALDTIPARVFANLATSAVLHVLAQPRAAAGPTPDGAAESQHALGEPDTTRTRFYARLGGTLGMAYLHSGQTGDRSIDLNTLNSASAEASNDPNATRSALRRRSYDCEVTDNNGGLVAQNCAPAIDSAGFVATGAGELTVGAMLTERLGLGLGARFRGGSPKMVLSRVLLSLSAEYELLDVAARGPSLRLLGGAGAGRISARPNGVRGGVAAGPYVTSGLWEVHGGVLAGYRITGNFGLFASNVVRTLFPQKLWAIDTTLGLEARL